MEANRRKPDHCAAAQDITETMILLMAGKIATWCPNVHDILSIRVMTTQRPIAMTGPDL
jgi:hypothetical protein